MTTPTFTPAHLTYEEWIEQNPNTKELEDCHNCQGTGAAKCFNCGQDTPCDECDGEGKVSTAREAYRLQRKRDQAVLDKYQSSLKRTTS